MSTSHICSLRKGNERGERLATPGVLRCRDVDCASIHTLLNPLASCKHLSCSRSRSFKGDVVKGRCPFSHRNSTCYLAIAIPKFVVTMGCITNWIGYVHPIWFWCVLPHFVFW